MSPPNVLSSPSVTYRLVSLTSDNVVGRTAATPELAKLVPPDEIDRSIEIFGLERTEWNTTQGKLHRERTVLVEVEAYPNEWKLGV